MALDSNKTLNFFTSPCICTVHVSLPRGNTLSRPGAFPRHGQEFPRLRADLPSRPRLIATLLHRDPPVPSKHHSGSNREKREGGQVWVGTRMGWSPEGRGGGGSSGSGRVAAGELRMVHAPAWRAVAARLPAAEEGEVRAVVGEALVEETFSLFAEAESVAEILDDLQGRAAARRASREVLGISSERSLLEAQIKELVEQIDKLAASPAPAWQGADRGQAPGLGSAAAGYPAFTRPTAPSAPRPPPTGGEVASRRPQTGRSRPGTAGSRPHTAGSRPSTASCGSGGSDSRRAVEEIGGSLNAFDVDEVRARLQEILREEREALLEDINYLQECLQDEMDGGGRESEEEEQSVESMKKMRDELKARYLHRMKQAELSQKVEQMLTAGGRGRVGRLRSAVSMAREQRTP